MNDREQSSYGFAFRKATSIVCLGVFLATDLISFAPYLLASTQEPLTARQEPSSRGLLVSSQMQRIEIPAGLGFIEDAYSMPHREHGAATSRDLHTKIHAKAEKKESLLRHTSHLLPKTRSIIFIQDAHDSFEAQKNIARIIRGLTRRYGIHTVFEEGYEGEVPTEAYFGQIPSKAIRKRVATVLMDRLRLNGAEFSHIDHKQDFRLIGIDRFRLHQQNLRQYRKTLQVRSAIESDLHALRTELQWAADKFFPAPVKQWMKDRTQFLAGSLSLLDYLCRIRSLSAKTDPDLIGELPAIAQLFQALENQGNGKTAVSAERVFRELPELEKRFLDPLLPDPAWRRTVELQTKIELLLALSRLTISYEQYQAYRNDLRSFSTREVGRHLERLTGKWFVFSKGWEKKIFEAVRFYEIAEERDEAIRSVLREHFNSRAEGPAILVYGGFHKTRILEILRDLGLSTLVITPRITQTSSRHQDYYRELMGRGHYGFEPAGILNRALSQERLYWLVRSPRLFLPYAARFGFDAEDWREARAELRDESLASITQDDLYDTRRGRARVGEIEKLVLSVAGSMGLKTWIVGGTRYFRDDNRKDIDIRLFDPAQSDETFILTEAIYQKFHAELVRRLSPEIAVTRQLGEKRSSLFLGGKQVVLEFVFQPLHIEIAQINRFSRLSLTEIQENPRAYFRSEYYAGSHFAFREWLADYKKDPARMFVDPEWQKRVYALQRQIRAMDDTEIELVLRDRMEEPAMGREEPLDNSARDRIRRERMNRLVVYLILHAHPGFLGIPFKVKTAAALFERLETTPDREPFALSDDYYMAGNRELQLHAERVVILGAFKKALEETAQSGAVSGEILLETKDLIRLLELRLITIASSKEIDDPTLSLVTRIKRNLNYPLRKLNLYVTRYPCEECAKILAAAGIHRIVYGFGNVNRLPGEIGDQELEAKGVQAYPAAGFEMAIAQQNRFFDWLSGHPYWADLYALVKKTFHALQVIRNRHYLPERRGLEEKYRSILSGDLRPIKAARSELREGEQLELFPDRGQAEQPGHGFPALVLATHPTVRREYQEHMQALFVFLRGLLRRNLGERFPAADQALLRFSKAFSESNLAEWFGADYDHDRDLMHPVRSARRILLDLIGPVPRQREWPIRFGWQEEAETLIALMDQWLYTVLVRDPSREARRFLGDANPAFAVESLAHFTLETLGSRAMLEKNPDLPAVLRLMYPVVSDMIEITAGNALEKIRSAAEQTIRRDYAAILGWEADEPMTYERAIDGQRIARQQRVRRGATREQQIFFAEMYVYLQHQINTMNLIRAGHDRGTMRWSEILEDPRVFADTKATVGWNKHTLRSLTRARFHALIDLYRAVQTARRAEVREVSTTSFTTRMLPAKFEALFERFHQIFNSLLAKRSYSRGDQAELEHLMGLYRGTEEEMRWQQRLRSRHLSFAALEREQKTLQERHRRALASIIRISKDDGSEPLPSPEVLQRLRELNREANRYWNKIILADFLILEKRFAEQRRIREAYARLLAHLKQKARAVKWRFVYERIDREMQTATALQGAMTGEKSQPQPSVLATVEYRYHKINEGPLEGTFELLPTEIQYRSFGKEYRSQSHRLITHAEERKKIWLAIGYLEDIVFQMRGYSVRPLRHWEIRAVERGLEKIQKLYTPKKGGQYRIAVKNRIREAAVNAQENLRQERPRLAQVASLVREIRRMFFDELIPHKEQVERKAQRTQAEIEAWIEAPVRALETAVRERSKRGFWMSYYAAKELLDQAAVYISQPDEPGYRRLKWRLSNAVPAYLESIRGRGFPLRNLLANYLRAILWVKYDLLHKEDTYEDLDPAELAKIQTAIEERIGAILGAYGRSELRISDGAAAPEAAAADIYRISRPAVWVLNRQEIDVISASSELKEEFIGLALANAKKLRLYVPDLDAGEVPWFDQLVVERGGRNSEAEILELAASADEGIVVGFSTPLGTANAFTRALEQKLLTKRKAGSLLEKIRGRVFPATNGSFGLALLYAESGGTLSLQKNENGFLSDLQGNYLGVVLSQISQRAVFATAA
ncbi:MAG: hypothetical protein ACOY3K_01995 [Candidatus Omnitrophota bacterium]